MQHVVASFLLCCFLLNTVSLGFAANCATRAAALNSSSCAQWKDAAWVNDTANYFKNHKATTAQRNTAIDASQKNIEYMERLLQEGKRDHALALEGAFSALGRALNLPSRMICLNKSGERVPCPKSSGTEEQIYRQINGGKSGANKIVTGDTGGNPVNFCFGDGKGDADLMDKIKRLTALNKNELSDAIAVMVTGGSADSADPDYVHPLILEVAFSLYAQKLTKAEQDKIAVYLTPERVFSGIDSKYADNVRTASTSAIIAFSEQNPQAVEKKFALPVDAYEKAQQFSLASGSLVLSLPASAVFLQQLSVAAAELGPEAAEIAAFAEKVASVSKAGITVVSSVEVGGAVAVAGGVFFIYWYGLNEAYAPILQQTFKQAKEAFWHEVFTSSRSVDDSIILRVIPVDWSAEFAKYGSAAATTENTATCKRKRPNVDCSKITMKEVKSYFSSPNAPVSVGELNAYLRKMFGNTYTRSTTIGELLPRFPQGDRVGVLFDFIVNNCDSFTNSKGGTAFPKLVKKENAVAVEVEIGVNIGNTPLTQILSEGIIATLCRGNAYLNEVIDLGNGRRIRNTEHEKNGNHFHYEDGLCNHSINFTGAPFIDLMQSICAARS